MDSSFSHFKATVLWRKQRLEKKSGKFDSKKLNYNSNKGNNLEFPNPSQQELVQLKKSIREKLQSRKRKELIFLISFILTLLILFYYFV